jgi:Membrane bound beta barrel domain (DUF5777)
MKNFLSVLFILFMACNANAQDDLLKELDSIHPFESEVVPFAFKGLQICNMQSTKLAAKGETYILISHRFGDLTEGLDNFFGLDNALTKIGAIYGVTNWLQLGFSRQTYNKTYELAAKYKFANQLTTSFPFTIVGYNTLDINSNLKTEVYPNLKFTNRLAFTSQLLISSKVSESLSLEINPVFVYKNLIDRQTENKRQFVIAAGGRYKISKRMSINLEYAARMNPPKTDKYHDPLTLGLDIETGGHVFQMVFSNSQAMNDVAVFTNATGKWNGGSIYFGFNMYRVF